MVDDLVDHLNAQGYSADRLHGDMTQAMRDRVMNKFRKSGLEFLVATDVAARGIDVDDVEVVFNYDLPYDGEDYVHRIGRTGRKGRSGRAISFASGREVFQIRNIERYTNVRIQRAKPPTAVEVEEARANVFLEKLRETLKAGEYKRQDHLIERLLEEGFNSTDIASALLHHLQGTDGTSKTQREEEPRRQGLATFAESEAPRLQTPPLRTQQRPRVENGPAERRLEHPSRPASPRKPAGDRVPARIAHTAPKLSRRTPDGQTRLFINLGQEMGVGPGDVVGAILGETGLPGKVVGTIDVRERHLFVDVASEHV